MLQKLTTPTLDVPEDLGLEDHDENWVQHAIVDGLAEDHEDQVFKQVMFDMPDELANGDYYLRGVQNRQL